MIALIIAVLSPFVVRSVTGTVAVLAPCSCITLDDSTCPAPTRRHLEGVNDVLYERVEDGDAKRLEAFERALRFIDPRTACNCDPCSTTIAPSTENECCCVEFPSTKAPKASTKAPKMSTKAPALTGCGLATKAPKSKTRRALQDHELSSETGHNDAGETNYEPWSHPNARAKDIELLSPDPGIWKIRNFLDDHLLARVLEVVDRTGNQAGYYRRCNASSHRHIDNKSCFFLTEESAVTESDAEVVKTVLDMVDALWPTKNARTDTKMAHFDVMLTRGGSSHTILHHDLDGDDGNSENLTFATVTTLIYLTSGGPATYFPMSQVLVTPEKGSVLTWLNVNADGSSRPSALHGVQAAADDDADRLVMSVRTTFASDEYPIDASE